MAIWIAEGSEARTEAGFQISNPTTMVSDNRLTNSATLSFTNWCRFVIKVPGE